MSTIRVATCQLNTVVGDLEGNTTRVLEALSAAGDAGANLAVFPELVITGYPPEDLLLKPRFVADNRAALEQVAAATTDCAAIVGFVDQGLDLYNAAAVCHGGEIAGVYRKRVLPNYGVFDEQRYFAPGSSAKSLYSIAGVKVGVSVCEDAWAPDGPISEQANGGAELMVSLNASPYFAGRHLIRQRTMATRAVDASIPIVYVNQVGGQDELVFDGASMVIDANGAIVAHSTQFNEEISFVDVDVRPAFRKRLLDPRGREYTPPLPVIHVSDVPKTTDDGEPISGLCAQPLDPVGEIYNALVLGTADYARKNGFTDAVLGLSGGIDSSLVAVIAADALGAAHVHGVSMPSRYSSEGSKTDAAKLAANLGIDMLTAPIGDAHTAMSDLLGSALGEVPQGLTDENLQSRLRGITLMAMSNEFGWLVLATGNKSELAVGYSTLYGDSAGGFAVIKDVAKTTVYELCRWRNENGPSIVIPEDVLSKAPSAELRADQRDDQSLPPYEVLDPILGAYVEDDLTASEIQALGHDPELVRKVVDLVDKAEYKRRQSPLGVRVTPKAFGKDRRVPVTSAYRG